MSTLLCALSSFIYLTLLRPTRLVVGNLAAWSHGACIVYPSESFDPEAIVDAVEQERYTALHGVPTHFLGVLTECNGGNKQEKISILVNSGKSNVEPLSKRLR
jgi:acyl-CoA synthetase (AMP-forming)/AMP-acid ligase II